MMNNSIKIAEFRPELLPRRGEIIAWILAMLVAVSWVLLTVTAMPYSWVVPTTAILLLLSALGISLSNWMDRNTVICIDPSGISFRNGLRTTVLNWNEIEEVSIFDTNLGKKIQISGAGTQFAFHTMSVLERKGQVQARSGFAQGEVILKQVVEAAGLKVSHREGSGYYYARE